MKRNYGTDEEDRPDVRLSEHFSLKEFACPCCGRRSASQGLIQLLEMIRADIQKPIIITSGFRCRAYNDATPGASRQSRHLSGNAADIKVKMMSAQELYEVCDRINEVGGVGLYATHVHVDYRRPGETPRWARKEKL